MLMHPGTGLGNASPVREMTIVHQQATWTNKCVYVGRGTVTLDVCWWQLLHMIRGLAWEARPRVPSSVLHLTQCGTWGKLPSVSGLHFWLSTGLDLPSAAFSRKSPHLPWWLRDQSWVAGGHQLCWSCSYAFTSCPLAAQCVCQQGSTAALQNEYRCHLVQFE